MEKKQNRKLELPNRKYGNIYHFCIFVIGCITSFYPYAKVQTPTHEVLLLLTWGVQYFKLTTQKCKASSRCNAIVVVMQM